MHIAIHCTIEFDLYGMGLAIVEEVHYLISLQSPQTIHHFTLMMDGSVLPYLSDIGGVTSSTPTNFQEEILRIPKQKKSPINQGLHNPLFTT